MGAIKIIAIAFAIAFGTIIFITNDRIRKETFEVLNHKIGKSKVRIYNIFVILITLIIILYSLKILNNIKMIIGRNI